MKKNCLFILGCTASCATPHFHLGACYDSFNSMSLLDYTAKLALERGFFDDILNVTNFSVSIAPVYAGCSPTQAAQVSMPLLLGTGAVAGRIYSNVDAPPVIAINGCQCSSSTMTVSQQSVPFRVPMISGSSTSPKLSNKLIYSHFARTIPPDTLQAKGLGKIVDHFGWKRVYSIHMLGDAYGEGLATSFCSDTRSRGLTCEIRTFPRLLLLMDQASLPKFEANWHLAVTAANELANELPPPRISLIATDASSFPLQIYALELAGLVTNKHFWLVAESVCSIPLLNRAESLVPGIKKISNNSMWNLSFWFNVPERLRCLGCLIPHVTGPRLLSAAFNNFWTNLTSQAIIQAGLSAAKWDQTWLDRNNLVRPYWILHFDGMTTIFVAISRMLAQGFHPSAIHGDVLRDAILNTSFEGLSGRVSFDSNGDRELPYIFKNLQMRPKQTSTAVINQSNGRGGINVSVSLVQVGFYDTTLDLLDLHKDFIFRDGTTTIPLDAPAPCLRGFEYSGLNKSCVPCNPGMYGIQQVKVTACVPCPGGTFSNTSEATDCTFCQPGRAGSLSGETACARCMPGKVAATKGAESCDDCIAGSSQKGTGATACNRCSIASYAVGSGSVQCIACPPGLVTEYMGAVSPFDCRCPSGTYSVSAQAFTCKKCPTGMTCLLGSTQDAFNSNNGTLIKPILKTGYWSSPDHPMVTFQCVDDTEDSHCRGGVPPGCDGGRIGVVCSRCPQGRKKTDYGCEDCSGWDVFIVISFLVVILIAPLALFPWLFPCHKWRMTAAPALMMTIEILIELGQTVACVGNIRVKWPTITEYVLEFFNGIPFQFFWYNPVGSFPCIMPSLTTSVVLEYLGLVVLIPGIAAYCWVLYPFCSRWLPEGIRWDYYATVHSVFKFLNIVFMSQVFLSMLPFQCYEHPSPNPEKSVQTFPSTFCYSDDHFALLIIGIVSSALCVAFYAYMCWETWRFKKTFASTRDRVILISYIRRITFLLEDFKLEKFYWNAIAKVVEFCLGGIVIALIPNSTPAQILIYVIICLICVCVWTACLPYKVPILNLAAVFTYGVTALVLIAAGLQAANSFDRDFSQVFIFIAISSEAFMFVVLLSIGVLTVHLKGGNGDLLPVSLLRSPPSWPELKRRWNIARVWRDDDLEQIVKYWQVHDISIFAQVLKTFDVEPDDDYSLTDKMCRHPMGRDTPKRMPNRVSMMIVDQNYLKEVSVMKRVSSQAAVAELDVAKLDVAEFDVAAPKRIKSLRLVNL